MYDVHCAQDVVNPDTSHCNMMVLNGTLKKDNGDDKQVRPFLYAKVLGVCHTNIIYVSPGAVDYRPRWMDFLWVRWYKQIGLGSTGWSCRKADRVHFPLFASPTPEEESFGFLDPSSVLRAYQGSAKGGNTRTEKAYCSVEEIHLIGMNIMSIGEYFRSNSVVKQNCRLQ